MRQRVLIAEPEELIRRVARRALALFDIDIVEAADAETTLDVAREPFDVVLLAEDLRNGDGAPLYERFFDDPRNRAAPVIILATSRDLRDRVHLLEAGAADYVVRPFSMRELQARVRTHLRLARLAEDRVEEEARGIEERKSGIIQSFSLGVAHNVNNLLTALMGHIALARSSETDEEGDAHLDAATNCAQRMCGLAHQLLAFTGEMKSELQPRDFTEIVRWSVALFDHVALGSRIILRCDIADERVYVECDQFELTTAILQILANAREAMPEGGVATITSGVEGDEAVLRIVDTGKGMDPEMARRASEPFVTTKMTVGVGMGLTMAAGVMRSHGGSLDIDSTEGEGTTVVMRLPLVDPETVREAFESGRGFFRHDCRVALLADTAESLGVLGPVLEQARLRVLTFGEVDRLITELGVGSSRIEAVVVDMTTGSASAREIAAKIRSLKGVLPLVCLGPSASALPQDDTYTIGLIKPIQPDAILDALSAFPELMAAPSGGWG